MKRLGVIGVLTLAVVATACSSAAGRDEAGVIVKAGSVKVHELEIGDCLASAGVEASDTVNAVPCAEPHLSQVYHVYEMDAGAFPSQDDILLDAATVCLPMVETFVGVNAVESEYDLSYFAPTEDGWIEGRRQIACFLYHGGDDLIGSAEGSGR